jgi:hypothetical protein
MIHPSTMAGPNWFTGSFGTFNPFQQSSSTFFRSTPFAGPQGGFGPGFNPYQNPSFGFGPNTPQIQNMINEIVRQTVPTTLASFGIPTTGFSSPYGFSFPYGFSYTGGFQTPTGSAQFGPSFPGSPWMNPTPGGDWTETIRQATNQAIQNLAQQNPTLFSAFTTPLAGTPGLFGTNPQQNLANVIGQVCYQACQSACQTIYQALAVCVNEAINQQNQMTNTPFGMGYASQNLQNIAAQVCQQACQTTCQTICQAVATTVNESINQQNRTSRPSFANVPGTPFAGTSPAYGFANASSPFASTTGIPAGAGAF